MFVMFGQKMYGKVDRVPGLCYVTTKFAHLNFLPLIPIGGYIVLEGTESGGNFQGKPIRLSLKSVLAGYARGWLGLAIAICTSLAAIFLFAHAGVTPIPELVAALLVAIAAGCVLTLFVSGRFGGVLQVIVHSCSIGLYFLFDGVAAGNPFVAEQIATGLDFLVAANISLLTFGLTRLWNHAGPARHQQLMEELGMEVPPADGEPEEEDRWQQWDETEDRKRR